MPEVTMLDAAKLALRLTTDAFDDEINDLIEAATDDLGLCGVVITDQFDPLIKRAVVTYCKANFGQVEDGYYDRLKKSYDEQKAQLQSSLLFKEADG